MPHLASGLLFDPSDVPVGWIRVGGILFALIGLQYLGKEPPTREDCFQLFRKSTHMPSIHLLLDHRNWPRGRQGGWEGRGGGCQLLQLHDLVTSVSGGRFGMVMMLVRADLNLQSQTYFLNGRIRSGSCYTRSTNHALAALFPQSHRRLVYGDRPEVGQRLIALRSVRG